MGILAAATTSVAEAEKTEPATDCPICSKAASENYTTKVGGQLTRGVANVGLCWVELANRPVKEVKSGGNPVVGVAKGIGYTCLRFLEGLGEIVTAPLPKAKDGEYPHAADDCPLDVMGMTNEPPHRQDKAS